jgi:hypothetical protein
MTAAVIVSSLAHILFSWEALAAVLTLMIFTYLWRDNPIYKFAEYLFVGVAAGYGLAIQYQQTMIPNMWTPLRAGRLEMIIPFVFGLLLFTRFLGGISWLSRWSIGLLLGTFSGLAIIGAAQGDLGAQMQANFLPFVGAEHVAAFREAPGLITFLGVLTNPFLILGLLFTLLYFFFSLEHRGSVGYGAKVGIYFLMISFGASFGFTVMSRISLLLGRLQFLFSDWLGLVQLM